MMLDRIRTYLLSGNSFYGVEHCAKNGESIYSVVGLKKKNNELNIVSSSIYTTIEEVHSNIPNGSSVHLVVNTTAVLSSKIQGENKNIEQQVNRVFPSININDFYLEIIGQETESYISICRKDVVDKIIDLYAHNKIYVTGLTLGNLGIVSITNFFRNEEIYTSNAKISIDDGAIDDVEYNALMKSEEHAVNGLKISSELILALCAALNSAGLEKAISSNFDFRINHLQSEFKQFRFYKLFMRFGLLFLLFALLLNFAAFSYYFNRMNEMGIDSRYNDTKKQVLADLSKEVNVKEKILANLNQTVRSSSSKYINLIVEKLPASILLSELQYQPIKKTIKREEEIVYSTDIIRISGESSNNQEMVYWMEKLDKLDFIAKVTVINIVENSSNVYVFEIQLDLKNDD